MPDAAPVRPKPLPALQGGEGKTKSVRGIFRSRAMVAGGRGAGATSVCVPFLHSSLRGAVDTDAGCQAWYSVFVSVLNPHEPAKNLTALIGGFLEFHSEHPKSLLLLKLIVDNAGDRLDNLMTGIRPHISGYELIDSDAVWLATAQLAEPALADLYRFPPPIYAAHPPKVKTPHCRSRWPAARCRSRPVTRRCSTISAKKMP